jgi:hypothetical protein
MTGFKVFLVLLALVLIAFVMIEVLGTQRNDPKMDADTFSDVRHPVLESTNAVLEPFSPKLQLTTVSFPLSAAPGKDQIVVPTPVDNDHPIRFAVFELSAPGCANITYTEPGKEAIQWPPDARHAADSGGSFLIAKAGGFLSLALHRPATACQVVFQK